MAEPIYIDGRGKQPIYIDGAAKSLQSPSGNAVASSAPGVNGVPAAPAEPGILDTITNYLQHINYGLASVTQVPARIAEQAYSGADALLRRINGDNVEHLPGADSFKASLDRVDQSIRDVTGAQPPTNIAERTVENVAPAALHTALSVLYPPAATALAGNALTGLVLPGVQSTSALGLLAELGIPYAAQEGLTELANPSANTAVDEVRKQIQGPLYIDPPGKEVDQLVDSQPDTVKRYQTAQIIGGALAILGGASVAHSVLAGAANNRRLQQAATQNPFSAQVENPLVASDLANETLSEFGSLNTPTNKGLDALGSFLFDTQHPIEVGLKKAADAGIISPELQQRLSSQKNVTRYQALAGMYDDFVRTGRFPGSKLKAQTPLIEIGKRIEQLSPDQQGLLERLVLAQTKLDTMQENLRQGKTNPKLYQWRNPDKGIYEDYGSLQAMVQKIRQDPTIAKIADDWHATMRSSIDYMLEKGLIDRKLHAEMLRVNTRYMPLAANKAGAKWSKLGLGGQDVGTKGIDLGELPFLKQRGQSDEQLPPGTLKNPFDASVEYFQNLIRYGTINDLNAQLARVFSNTRMGATNERLMVPTKLKSVPVADGKLYRTIRINGKPIIFRVNDQALYSALAHRPQAGFNALTAAANFKAFWLTGPGNPAFLIKQYGYETLGAIMNRPTGTRLGLIDPFFGYAPKSFIGKHAREVLYSIDPTQLLAMPVGALKRFYADLMHSAWLNTKTNLVDNQRMQLMAGAGDAVLGKQRLEAISELMRYGYERSAYANMTRSGAGHVAMFQGPWQKTDINDTLKGLERYQGYMHSPMYEYYKYLINAFKEGARLQYFSANQAKEWRVAKARLGGVDVPVFGYLHNKDDIVDNIKAAAKTRELVGDPARHGGDVSTASGRTYQQIAHMTLYGNVTMQAMSAMAKAIKDHPTRFFATGSALMAAGVLGYAEWAKTPEGREAIKKMTPEQRASIVPYAQNGIISLATQVPQEYRPFYGAALHAILGQEGVLDWSENEDGDILKLIADVLGSQVAPSGPLQNPLVSVGLNLLGQEPTQSGWGMQAIKPNPLDQPMADGERKEQVLSMLDSIFGTSMLMSGEAIRLVWNAIEQKNSDIDPKYKPDWFDVGTLPALKYEENLKKSNFALFGINPSTPVAGFAWKKIQESKPAMEQILANFTRVRTSGENFTITGNNPDMMDFIPPGNPRDAALGSLTYALQARMKPLIDQRSSIQKNIYELQKAAAGYRPDANREMMNSYNAEKQKIDNQMLEMIRQTEAQISKALGEEFTYERYKP